MIKIYVRLVYLVRAIKCANRVHLGEIVTINKVDYFLNNGVKRKEGKTLWDCLSTHSVEHCACVEATQSEMKRKPFAWIGSIKHTYKFFMSYWYGIDVMNRSTSSSSGLIT